MKLFGHVSRAEGLAKTILKCKEGEDEEDKRSVGKIISDWIGLRFCDALRESKKTVVRFLAPQQSS